MLTSVLYLSAFYLIGLVISTIVQRTATSLMLSMFAWAFLTLIYPNLIMFAIPVEDNPSEAGKAAFAEIAQIWERFDRERLKFLKSDPVEGEHPHFNMEGPGRTQSPEFRSNSATLRYFQEQAVSFDQLSEDSETRVPYAKAYFGFVEPMRIKTAEKTWLAREKALDRIFVRVAKRDLYLLRLSPAAPYNLATAAWAGTDLQGIRHLFDAARQYRRTLIDYLYDKEAFSSRQWFASDLKPATWSDLPQFTYRRADVWVNARSALPDLLLLLLINVALFMATLLIFTRQEV